MNLMLFLISLKESSTIFTCLFQQVDLSIVLSSRKKKWCGVLPGIMLNLYSDLKIIVSLTVSQIPGK